MIDARSIDTERLTMRVHTLADFPDSFALWANPEVVRYIGGRTSTEEEAWARVLRNAGHWELLKFGSWIVREKATGKFVGEVGWANFHRAMDPPLGDAPEGGWVITPEHHGRGYATEALRAALAWSDAHFDSKRRVCIIDEGNDASVRVATKCGFREVRRSSYKGAPAIVLERDG